MGIEDKSKRIEQEETWVTGKALTATIASWKTKEGFGFLRLADGRRAFVHVSELCHHLNPGHRNLPALNMQVHVGEIVSEEKGFKALKVECGDCIKPAVWELRPTGPAIFGIQELKPVCVNKPDEPHYKCTIKFNEIWKANEPFHQAKEKQSLWQGSLGAKFFEEFGEPQSVSSEGEDKVILAYPHGTKTVRACEAYESGHWKTSPTGQWNQGKYPIEAEFIFDNIPQAKVFRIVANIYGQPKLEKDFDLLPANTQNEILPIVRKEVRPSVNIAEEKFQEFLSSEYYKKEIEEVRKAIIDLQAPGEIHVGMGGHKAQEEVTGHYGDETWGTGRYVDVQRTYWYLKTGAKKREHYSWAGEYVGGNSFPIAEPQKGETPEQIRDQLIMGKRRKLKELFERAKKINPIPTDPRLYDVTPEEWTEQYEKKWDILQKEIEQKWQREELSALEQLKADEETHEKVVIELRQIREEVQSVDKRAGDLRIDLSSLNSPGFGEIGTDSLGRLSEIIQSLRQYVAEANTLIADQLQQRCEIEIAATQSNEDAERKLREAMESPAKPATWHLSGIAPEVLERYGRKYGEGFGQRVAGKSLYLPGDKAVVGIGFSGRTRRYLTAIESAGLESLTGSLPQNVYKDDVRLLAMVENSNWAVKWIRSHDGIPYEYSLANAKGIGSLLVGNNNDYDYESNSWEHIGADSYEKDGKGPTAEEITKAHNLGKIFVSLGSRDAIGRSTDDFANVTTTQGKTAPSSTNIEAVQEIQRQVTFTDKGKRHFQCSCGCMERISKTEFDKYRQGQELTITCNSCKGRGTLKKV